MDKEAIRQAVQRAQATAVRRAREAAELINLCRGNDPAGIVSAAVEQAELARLRWAHLHGMAKDDGIID